MLARQCGNCFYAGGECLVVLVSLRLAWRVGAIRCDVLRL